MKPNRSKPTRPKSAQHINSKVQPFREHYQHCLSNSRNKSSLHRIATQQYSLSLHKKSKMSTSTRSKLHSNPEEGSVLVRGIAEKSSQILAISDVNTELLLDKHSLERRIEELREAIARETRKRNKAEQHWKKYRNETQKAKEHLQGLRKKSTQFNEGISSTFKECEEEKKALSKMQFKVLRVIERVEKQKRNVGHLVRKVAHMKNNMMMEEKERQWAKTNLIKKQKAMDSASLRLIECQNQQATVLMAINEQVSRNRL